MIEFEVADDAKVLLTPDCYLCYLLENALYKARHQQWDHVQQIVDSLWAPLAALTDQAAEYERDCDRIIAQGR